MQLTVPPCLAHHAMAPWFAVARRPCLFAGRAILLNYLFALRLYAGRVLTGRRTAGKDDDTEHHRKPAQHHQQNLDSWRVMDSSLS
jgi:hypothetical protein